MFVSYPQMSLIPMGTRLMCHSDDLAPEGRDDWPLEDLILTLQEILEDAYGIEDCENPHFMARWTAILGGSPAERIGARSDLFLFYDGADGATFEEDEETEPCQGMGVLFYRQDSGDIRESPHTIHRVHIPPDENQETLFNACSHLWRVDGQSGKAYGQIEGYLLGILNDQHAWAEIEPNLGTAGEDESDE